MKNESGFTPTGDLVLILPPPVEEKSKGGIVLVDSTRQAELKATQIGKIVAMGEDAKVHPRLKGVEEDSIVLFGRYSGLQIEFGGQLYHIVRAENILGLATRTPDYALRAAKSTLEAFGSNNETAAA